MSIYEDLGGDWELQSWIETMGCESSQKVTKDRTAQFRPFHLTLTPPGTGPATGSLDRPTTGGHSSFEWILFGEPPSVLRFRRVTGDFHRFERMYDMEIRGGRVLTLKRSW